MHLHFLLNCRPIVIFNVRVPEYVLKAQHEVWRDKNLFFCSITSRHPHNSFCSCCCLFSLGQGQFSQLLQGCCASEFQQDHCTCAELDIMGLESCDISVERCKMRRRKSGVYNNKYGETLSW